MLLLGALLYLYVVYMWYGTATVLSGTWLMATQFLAPFVATFAVVGSVSLFFKGLKMVAGKADSKETWLWKFLITDGMAMLILGGPMNWTVLLGFLLTYIGAVVAMM